MYQTRIANVEGKLCRDETGRTLERIGNMPVRPGDAVWTDGRCVYGTEQFHSDAPMVFHRRDGGIPVGFGKKFYLLSDYNGRILQRYTVDGDVDIIGFVNDGEYAFVALSADGGKHIAWHDLKTGSLVYTTDARTADAQVESGGRLLTLELNGKKRIGLYRSGTLSVPLPTANEVARDGLGRLLAEAGSSDGTSTVYGHVGRITKGGHFYTTLANFSGQAVYESPDSIRLSKHATVRVTGTMRASGRAYTEDGKLTWAQYSTNFQNPSVGFVEYGMVNEAEKDDEPVEDAVLDVLQGVGAVTQWTDPYLRDDDGIPRSTPILILIIGGDGFTTHFPFPKELYESEAQYWDAWGRCISMADGSQFIKEKGDALLSAYVRPGGMYYYYTNTTANDTSTYSDRFPLNDDFVIERSGNTWNITDGGRFVYSSATNFSQASLYRLGAGGYLIQNGAVAERIDRTLNPSTAVCGSRNYRFCSMPRVDGVLQMLRKVLSEQYGAAIR